MLQVNGLNNELSLKDVIDFLNVTSDFEWIVFDLQYNGKIYNNLFPLEIEGQSKFGVRFSIDEFFDFESSINQIIDGEFICRRRDFFKQNQNSRDEKNTEIKIIFVDGSFWEIGGRRCLEFIDRFSLSAL